MNYMTPKTLDNMYDTSKVLWIHKNIQIVWRHLAAILEFLSIERVTYGCQSGNQARIVLKWPQYKNHE